MIVCSIVSVNGKDVRKTKSDVGVKIIGQDGVMYDVAYDPISITREYSETGIPVEYDE